MAGLLARAKYRFSHNNNVVNLQEQLKRVSQEQPLYLTCGEVYGHSVNLTAMTLNSGEYLILIGNGNPKRFIPESKRRWDIEERFACWKSRGFNFEDTHFTNPPKISKIMAILTLAFLGAVKTGPWRHPVKPIPQKNVTSSGKKYFSVWFRAITRGASQYSSWN